MSSKAYLAYARDEADETSDIDILIEAKPSFVERYGIRSIKERIEEIKREISSIFGVSVDLADKTGMGKTAQKFIIDRTIMSKELFPFSKTTNQKHHLLSYAQFL